MNYLKGTIEIKYPVFLEYLPWKNGDILTTADIDKMNEK
jgi:hypothetical protein